MLDRLLKSDPARRALRTFLQAFAVLFVGSLLTWLGDVQEWASCIEECAAFPDPGALAKGAVAAVTAGAIAVFTYFQNLLEDRGTVKDRR